MKDFSYITGSSPEFIENLYRDFVADPASVDPELRKFFEGFDFAVAQGQANGKTKEAPTGGSVKTTTKTPAASTDDLLKEIQVYRMIVGYRNKGRYR